MKKIARILLPAFIGLILTNVATAQPEPFRDRSLGVEARVADLLRRLTLDEKLSLMEHANPAVPRLGIVAYSWWNEALHGVARNGLATVYPMPIALAATFDTAAVRATFAGVASEAIRKRLDEPDSNLGKDYRGLTFFTPNVNIFRDPRWGRGMETYGEDPFLTAMMGAACVRGLQSAGAAACLKHLAAHSGPEGKRHEFDSRADAADLWNTYLPAFEYIVRHTDVRQVMCGYNRLNGKPCCTDAWLLGDVLRRQWGFDGIVVTDCWALNDCWEPDTVIPRHRTHPTAAMAAADAFGGEVDLECGSGLGALCTAVDSGYLDESVVDGHVARILALRMRTNTLFVDEPPAPTHAPLTSPKELCKRSLVLLKNDGGLLPLDPLKTRVYVDGTNADDTIMPLGNYNGYPAHCVSVAEGLSGCFAMALCPEDADVIVYVGGLGPQLEGEELPIEQDGFIRGDRTRIELPADQLVALRELRAYGKPIVFVLCSGSAVALGGVADLADAILVGWYGGQDMGDAIAEAISNKNTFFGRLPLTFYASTSQLPHFDDYQMDGRTYRYLAECPLYPFGYGLGYGEVEVVDVAQSKDAAGVATFTGTVRLKDPARPGNVVLQAYAYYPDVDGAPLKNLVGMLRIDIPAGVIERIFTLKVEPDMMQVYDPKAGRRHTVKTTLSLATSSREEDVVYREIH